MNILIVGGTRFLGWAIVDAALGRGHELTLNTNDRCNPQTMPVLLVVTKLPEGSSCHAG